VSGLNGGEHVALLIQVARRDVRVPAFDGARPVWDSNSPGSGQCIEMVKVGGGSRPRFCSTHQGAAGIELRNSRREVPQPFAIPAIRENARRFGSIPRAVGLRLRLMAAFTCAARCARKADRPPDDYFPAMVSMMRVPSAIMASRGTGSMVVSICTS